MTGTRAEWLAGWLELLDAEKELTRRSDALARRRQEPTLERGVQVHRNPSEIPSHL
jgi:predicted dithiol-disulfide oxidoreductase (DUF899 family)